MNAASIVTTAQEPQFDVTALAEKGDGDALFALAILHDLGQGVPQNSSEAARLLQRAADGGHVASKVQLGLMFQTGTGVSRNPQRAVALFEEAARANDIEAQFRLGMASVYGLGVQQDAAAARRWFAPAAAGGHQEAQLMLGIMMQAGTGGQKNEFSGRRWLRQAAAGSDPAVSGRARDLVAKIDKRLLFSGAFRPEEAAVIAAISAGLAILILGGNGGEAGLRQADPSDPFNYAGLSSTRRRQRCFQEFKWGPYTPNGRMTSMSSPRTITRCVSY
ncbi:MAG: tetratricopeptide repeat protein [Vicinamibacterales bacterium]